LLFSRKAFVAIVALYRLTLLVNALHVVVEKELIGESEVALLAIVLHLQMFSLEVFV
jgi:hypothetical protein